MAYNKAKAERQWFRWKEAEEKEPGHDYSKQFENGRRRVWREYECGHSDYRRF